MSRCALGRYLYMCANAISSINDSRVACVKCVEIKNIMRRREGHAGHEQALNRRFRHHEANSTHDINMRPFNGQPLISTSRRPRQRATRFHPKWHAATPPTPHVRQRRSPLYSGLRQIAARATTPRAGAMMLLSTATRARRCLAARALDGRPSIAMKIFVM